MPGTEAIISEKLLQGLSLVSMFPYSTFISLHPKYLPVHEASCVTQI